MNRQTLLALNAINRDFYAADASAAEFSATRDHPWPGWERVWSVSERTNDQRGAESGLSVLDVGCGNGRFAEFLANRSPTPAIHYVGVDASRPLLESAKKRAEPLTSARFLRRDWVEETPDATSSASPTPHPSFDLIAVFGVLHHVPGFEARRALLVELADRLAPKGILALTLWRFGEASLWPRFQHRAIEWNDYNRRAPQPLDLSQLEPGDHLLRWGDSKEPEGHNGPLRYCHYTDPTELNSLLTTLPLKTLEHYTDDGRSKDVNEYILLQQNQP